MAMARGPKIVTDGLLFLFDAGNHKSYPGTGTTVTDLIGKVSATMNNITVANGHFNFNGTTSDITFTKTTAQSDPWTGGGTAQAWIRAESDGENNSGRILNASQLGGSVGWLWSVLNESAGTIQHSLRITFSTTAGLWTTTDSFPLNTWVNVAVTYDSDSVSNDPIFYVNGEVRTHSETSTPVGSYVSEVGEDLIVGNRPADDRTYDGDNDYSALYGRILSAAEIRQNFNALRGRFGI